MCEICLNLTIKTQNEVNGVLVFLLSTLNILQTFFQGSICDLKQENVFWVLIN